MILISNAQLIFLLVATLVNYLDASRTNEL